MGKVRKKFPKELKELKAKALELSNDITYDLIAVNKAARSESKDRAYEVRVSCGLALVELLRLLFSSRAVQCPTACCLLCLSRLLLVRKPVSRSVA